MTGAANCSSRAAPLLRGAVTSALILFNMIFCELVAVVDADHTRVLGAGGGGTLEAEIEAGGNRKLGEGPRDERFDGDD